MKKSGAVGNGTLNEKFSTLQTQIASTHNVDFEGVAGAIKFHEYMKMKAKRNAAKAQDALSKTFTQPHRKNKMNTKYVPLCTAPQRSAPHSGHHKPPSPPPPAKIGLYKERSERRWTGD